MKLVNILLLFVVGITSCNAQIKKDFKSAEERASALREYYEKASSSIGEERAKYEQLFFDAFPSSFQEMQELFSFDEEKGAAPLYDYPIGSDIITFFSDLKHVEENEYYNKYINICIDGNWEADNIGEGFGIWKKLNNDTKDIVPLLSKRTDKEIISVFYFLYDAPHPEPWGQNKQALYEKIRETDPHVAELMK